MQKGYTPYFFYNNPYSITANKLIIASYPFMPAPWKMRHLILTNYMKKWNWKFNMNVFSCFVKIEYGKKRFSKDSTILFTLIFCPNFILHKNKISAFHMYYITTSTTIHRHSHHFLGVNTISPFNHISIYCFSGFHNVISM